MPSLEFSIDRFGTLLKDEDYSSVKATNFFKIFPEIEGFENSSIKINQGSRKFECCELNCTHSITENYVNSFDLHLKILRIKPFAPSLLNYLREA